MSESLIVKPIAHIFNDYKSKFGIPRQSGIAASVVSKIVFEAKYKNPDALRGIEGYSHLWLIWHFSKAVGGTSLTVRPPKLGGNTRMGVFATRSPFRPNPLGLSSVRLIRTELDTTDGPVLYVAGADLADGTPIFDIKPYLSYTDSHADAESGFALSDEYRLSVCFAEDVSRRLPDKIKENLAEILAHDPRPGYRNSDNRLYKLEFGEFDIGFCVDDDGIIVVSADKLD